MNLTRADAGNPATVVPFRPLRSEPLQRRVHQDASKGIGDASERTFDRKMPDWAASTSASRSMSAALSIMVVHHRGPPTQLKHGSVPRRG